MAASGRLFYLLKGKVAMKMIVAVILSLASLIHDRLFRFMAKQGLVLGIYGLADGSKVFLSTSFGDSTSMTAVSNAEPAVATLEASHAIAADDILMVSSGWGFLDGRAVKAGTPSVNDIPLLGIDSTDTTDFPAGSGVGSVIEVLTFTQITHILEWVVNGGAPKYVNFQFLEELRERQLFGGTGAKSIELTLTDENDLAGYTALKNASDSGDAQVLKVVLPGGGVILYNAARVFLDESVILQQQNVRTVKAFISLGGLEVRY